MRRDQAQEAEEESCPVCFGPLCEPVPWPQCMHHLCLICALRTRQRPKPSCPLCRAPAPRALEAVELQVDDVRAAVVRQTLGAKVYDNLRSDLWEAAGEVAEFADLGALPLFCMGRCRFAIGTHLDLRLFEPRYREMIRRAVAPGGARKFAVILRPAAPESGEVFGVGAVGRVCEVVDSEQSAAGDWRVTVEGGVACRVRDVNAEEVEQGAPPLFHGTLEEVDEEELNNAELEDAMAVFAALRRGRRRWRRQDEDDAVDLHDRHQPSHQNLDNLMSVLESLRLLNEHNTTELMAIALQHAELVSLVRELAAGAPIGDRLTQQNEEVTTGQEVEPPRIRRSSVAVMARQEASSPHLPTAAAREERITTPSAPDVPAPSRSAALPIGSTMARSMRTARTILPQQRVHRVDVAPDSGQTPREMEQRASISTRHIGFHRRTPQTASRPPSTPSNVRAPLRMARPRHLGTTTTPRMAATSTTSTQADVLHRRGVVGDTVAGFPLADVGRAEYFVEPNRNLVAEPAGHPGTPSRSSINSRGSAQPWRTRQSGSFRLPNFRMGDR